MFVGPPDFRWLVILQILFWFYQQGLWFSKFELFEERGSLILYFLFHIVSVIALWNFIATSLNDPGVFLRHKNYEDFKYQYDERKLEARRLKMEL